MGQLIGILGGLVTTLIGYLIGRTWQKAVDRIPFRRAKIFWQPLLNGDIQVVVSRFESASFNEPTGLVGGGDALALRELSSYFSRIGLRRHRVVYVDEATLDRKNNLVLLGGPDSNAVTRDALELIAPRLRLLDPGPGIPVEVHDLAPAPDHGGEDSVGITPQPNVYIPKADIDYGVIIRARNPFAPDRGLVIFAGAYGYGTWGGVNLVLSDDDFLHRCRELEAEFGQPSRWGLRSLVKRVSAPRPHRGGSPDSAAVQLECLFRVGVYDRQPHAHEIIVFRNLPTKSTNAGQAP